MALLGRLATAGLLLLVAARASAPRGSDRLAHQAQIGTLSLRSYLYGSIEPGEDVLGATVQGSSTNRLRFTAEAGRNYVFKVSPAWSFAGWAIDPLDEADGRALEVTPTPHRARRQVAP